MNKSNRKFNFPRFFFCNINYIIKHQINIKVHIKNPHHALCLIKTKLNFHQIEEEKKGENCIEIDISSCLQTHIVSVWKRNEKLKKKGCNNRIKKTLAFQTILKVSSYLFGNILPKQPGITHILNEKK